MSVEKALPLLAGRLSPELTDVGLWAILEIEKALPDKRLA